MELFNLVIQYAYTSFRIMAAYIEMKDFREDNVGQDPIDYEQTDFSGGYKVIVMTQQYPPPYRGYYRYNHDSSLATQTLNTAVDDYFRFWEKQIIKHPNDIDCNLFEIVDQKLHVNGSPIAVITKDDFLKALSRISRQKGVADLLRMMCFEFKNVTFNYLLRSQQI